ncbi:hypothetical protein D6D00_09241 [Aureobasidium pullulans]|nr:hypothetical protein D6D00_09241 [Aureobasidium pullulans]
MEWSPVEWIFTPSIDNFAEDARLEAAHGEPKDQTLDQSSGVTGKSIVAQNKELQDEVARLRWGLDGIKKIWSITTAKVVRDVRIRALEDASSGPVSLDGLSGHNKKHGEDSPMTSDGHMLTYGNLNASQSLTGDLGGVKSWLTATSNDTV